MIRPLHQDLITYVVGAISVSQTLPMAAASVSFEGVLMTDDNIEVLAGMLAVIILYSGLLLYAWHQ